MDAKKTNTSGNGSKGSNEWRVKVGLAEMLKGGVIMDVTNAEQAKIAEKAGACAVMALERVPSDIRWHPLQRHHCARAGLFGNLRLFRVRDVHDHAAFEHLRQADFHAPLIRSFAPVAACIRLLRIHRPSPLDP